MFQEFVIYLQENLHKEGFLPGIPVQRIMAPFRDDVADREFLPPSSSKPSSVLVVMKPEEETFSLLYTVRSTKLRNHTKQISFPGGRADKNESVVETALREANEEIGLEQSNVQILGRLSPLFVPNSNSGIIPVIAILTSNQEFHLNTDEVEELFYTNIKELNNSNISHFPLEYNNNSFSVPYWKVHPTIPLWGATAIISKELQCIWEEFFNLKS